MFDFYTILTSIVIGIIQGITEFLPISSTGHIIIASHWLKIENNSIKILEIFIQFGSALAILCFFYKKIIKAVIFEKNILSKKTKNIHIIISILPTALIGLIYYKEIKLLFNIHCVIYSLMSGGLFFLISEILKPKKCKTCRIKDISLIQSAIIGFCQIFSLCPGFSRSGITIATGMLLGIKKSVAIEYSFIISIPLLIGASLFDFINNIHNIKKLDFSILFIGFIISFIISFLFIETLLKIINKISLIFFTIYRFVISGLIYFIN